MRYRRAVFITGLAAFLGCSSDATAPNSLLGQLLFGYSGGITGNFSASFGPYVAGSNAASYVAGQHDAVDGMVYALASVSTGASTRDFAIVAISRTTPGNVTIDPNCSTEFCAGFFAIFGQNQTSGGWTQLCTLEAGTLTITSLTATRVKGTFSGTGSCAGATGTITSFTVTGGTFDAALVSDTPDT